MTKQHSEPTNKGPNAKHPHNRFKVSKPEYNNVMYGIFTDVEAALVFALPNFYVHLVILYILIFALMKACSH